VPKAGIIYNDGKPSACEAAATIEQYLTAQGWDVVKALGVGGILGYASPESPVCHTPIDYLVPPGFEENLTFAVVLGGDGTVLAACRQVGPIAFKAKFEQGDEVFRQRRSLFFKKMRIVRGCDKKRNVLVYVTYTDKLIEGSPENSTSTVPIMPWGQQTLPRCAEWVTD